MRNYATRRGILQARARLTAARRADLYLPAYATRCYQSATVGPKCATDFDATTEDSSVLRSSKSDRKWQAPRRRGFDDDNFYGNAPSPPTFPTVTMSSSAPEVQATVKWFNAEKGYGFAALADGTGDVFLHVNALQAAGHQTVSPGATLKVRVGNGQKGRQIDQVVTVDESTAEQPGSRPAQSGPRGPRPPSAPRRPVDLSNASEMLGTVKWYNAEKGFGFITPQSGGKDVFVHATALERAGLPPLQEGQTVRIGVVQGAKGPEAASVATD
jgi:CspA family cold shock protein